MQVNLDTTNKKYNQNFTAVVYDPRNTKGIANFIDSLSKKNQCRINKVIEEQKNNPTNIYLYLKKFLGITVLKAEVGLKNCYGLFSSARAIEKAAKAANKLHLRQQQKQKLLKGFNTPSIE